MNTDEDQDNEYNTESPQTEYMEKNNLIREDVNVEENFIFNNHFTVVYDANIYIMKTDGIYVINGDGVESRFVKADCENPNLYSYADYLYFIDSNNKIHTISLENKDEIILGDGAVSCAFYGDYLTTYMPDDNYSPYTCVAYKIDKERGIRTDETIYSVSDIDRNDLMINHVMSPYCDFKYKTEDNLIIPQILGITNSLNIYNISGTLYYYDITANGIVSIQKKKDQMTSLNTIYEKNMKTILEDDCHPILTSLVINNGVIFSEISDNGQNTFPLYYNENNTVGVIYNEKMKTLILNKIVNYDGQWVYYLATDTSVNEQRYGCYRINKETMENQLLYSSEFDIVFYRNNVADIQDNCLFYWNYESDNYNMILLN